MNDNLVNERLFNLNERLVEVKKQMEDVTKNVSRNNLKIVQISEKVKYFETQIEIINKRITDARNDLKILNKAYDITKNEFEDLKDKVVGEKDALFTGNAIVDKIKYDGDRINNISIQLADIKLNLDNFSEKIALIEKNKIDIEEMLLAFKSGNLYFVLLVRFYKFVRSSSINFWKNLRKTANLTYRSLAFRIIAGILAVLLTSPILEKATAFINLVIFQIFNGGGGLIN